MASGAVNIRAHGERMAEMRAFWLPSKTPEAAANLEAPDGVTRCPASGKPLRLRDLTSVALTPLPDGAAQEFMDPVSRDPFTNATRLMVIKPTGRCKRRAAHAVDGGGHRRGTAPAAGVPL